MEANWITDCQIDYVPRTSAVSDVFAQFFHIPGNRIEFSGGLLNRCPAFLLPQQAVHEQTDGRPPKWNSIREILCHFPLPECCTQVSLLQMSPGLQLGGG